MKRTVARRLSQRFAAKLAQKLGCSSSEGGGSRSDGPASSRLTALAAPLEG